MNEVSLNFIFFNDKVNIQCKREEFMKDILQRYASKICKPLTEIYFAYNGKQIDENLKLSQINHTDTLIKILVFPKEFPHDEKILKKSENIICPNCKHGCTVEITEDYKIKLTDNYHEVQVKIKDYENSQLIDETNIKCAVCDKSKADTFKNEFYFCCELKNFYVHCITRFMIKIIK